MLKYPLSCLLTLASTLTYAQYPTRFETSGGTQTPTYAEGIAYYQRFSADSDTSQGLTDSALPLLVSPLFE